ncbi:MAG: PAC2 family protein, partial [Chloroflexota bacterium]
MLRISAQPDLKSPVLLCAFGGWADAASAASGALRYLLLKRDGYRIAEFDPDAIYCYTTTRPVNLLHAAGRRTLQWPELALTAIEVPEAAHDLVVLVGPEPDLRWRECVSAIGSFASRLGVSHVITFGGFLAQVHYAGPTSLVGSSSDPQLKAKLLELGIEESSYQGPTGFVTAVLRDAADRGVPAASIWVAAPSYLSNTSNPKLAAELLRVAQQLLGQDLWLQELEAAGHDMDRRIEDALRARPDLADFLGRLSGEPEPMSHTGAQSEEQEG